MEKVEGIFHAVALFYGALSVLGVGVCIEWIIIYIREGEREMAVKMYAYMIIFAVFAFMGFYYSRG